jgi:membrane protease YdiL (CAAX protease family)
MTLPAGDDQQAEQSPPGLTEEVPAESSHSDALGVDCETNAAVDSDASTAIEESSPAFPLPHTPGPEEPLLFANIFQPEVRPPERIPHLGHVALLGVYFLFGSIASIAYLGILSHFHVFGISSFDGSIDDIRGALGGEVILYAVMFAASYFTFPLIWHKSFFDGLEWNGATALRLRARLFGAGSLCFVLAILNILFIPGPSDTPIEKVFKQPGAPWLLFFFGITVAPFFEELFFRGFLLPALCTAYDWLAEMFFHAPRRPLGPDGHPQWSLSAMAVASVVTSAPFALMHAEQTGNSVDAVLLLACVSLALCAVRLITRSLASSVLVHAFYNFLIFSMMLLGTEGFRHLDKM